MFSSKQAVGIVGVIVVVVIGMFIYWLVSSSLTKQQCKNDTDCGQGYYCGSDFSCHEFKVMQNTIVQYSLVGPTIILGMAIIFAAIILRWKRVT